MRKLEGVFSDWEGALRYFQTIVQKWPGTKWYPLAKFAIAYAHWKKGDCPTAVLLFDEFQSQFPSHPKVADALLYQIDCYRRDMKGPDRDVFPATKIVELGERFLSLFPEHERASDVKSYVQLARETIARHHLNIAKFYLRRGKYLSAVDRLKFVLSNYPDTSAGREAKELWKTVLRFAEE